MKRARAAVIGLTVVLVAVGCNTPYDFDNDEKSDKVVVQGDGKWLRYEIPTQATPNPQPVTLRVGTPGERPVPADYDGNGTTDVAVVTSTGDWVTQSSVGTFSFPAPPELPGFGPGHVTSPITVDLDGDLRREAAWFRDADATWFVQGRDPFVFGTPSTAKTNLPGQPYNNSIDQDTAVPADYDGDGKTDLAVYNPRTRVWRVKSSRDGSESSVTMGGDKQYLAFPVPGDYDGVGHAQRAIFSGGPGWLIEGHATADTFGTYSGSNVMDAFPAAADFDGDGKIDLAVVANDGVWRFKGAPPILDRITIGSAGFTTNFPVEFGGAIAIDRIARFTLVAKNCIPPTPGQPQNNC